MAVLTATPGKVPEQHRRAGPSAHQTPGPTGAGLWQSVNGTTNAGWLRGNGDDQKGTGSDDWWVRDAGAGRLRCGPVRDCGLIRTYQRISPIEVARGGGCPPPLIAQAPPCTAKQSQS